MTMYAVRNDLVKRFGEAEIALLEDPDNSGAPDTNISTSALSDAAEEADSYIGVRYVLPLVNTPAPLKIVVCDIARFRMYKDRATDEVKYRYENSVKWLKDAAAGKTLLQFNPLLTEQQTVDLTKPATPVVGHDTGSAFSDAVLSTMPTPNRGGSWLG